MKLTERVKPISYLKANGAPPAKASSTSATPMIITQNGEARAVIQDLASYEQTQESLALLKILALGQQEIRKGQIAPAKAVFARLRQHVAQVS